MTSQTRPKSVADCCLKGCEQYNLQELGTLFGLPFSRGHHTESAQSCRLLLESIINRTDIEIATETKIPCLEESTLTRLVSTLNQEPDLFLRLTGDVTAQMIVEIHSSPYEDTIRKSLIVATDLLRLRRMYDDGIKSITAFSFPKLPTAAHNFRQCGCESSSNLGGLGG